MVVSVTRYWLCVTTEDNWRVVREKLVWGVAERFRNLVRRIKPGDKLAIYVTQTRRDDEVIPSRIVGIFEVASEVYRDSSRIFKAVKRETTFPYRVKLKPIKIFDPPVYFKDLIPRLKFLRGYKKWSGAVRAQMREIPEEDFRVIAGEA